MISASYEAPQQKRYRRADHRLHHTPPLMLGPSRAGRHIGPLLGLVLVTVFVGHASAEPPAPPPGAPPSSLNRSACRHFTPQGYKVPGRPLDSEMPWEFFLGNASHRVIAYIYSTRYPTHTVFYNTVTVERILKETDGADSSLLLKSERLLRPDITNITKLNVFEIKPPGEQAIESGTRELQGYLRALNRAMPPDSQFSGGTGFEGEILIKFGSGQHIWQIEWCTIAPGVIQYRWTRSKEYFDSLEDAYTTGLWVELTEQELKQFGGWVAQVTEGLVDRREKLAALSVSVGVVIEVVGGAAILVISTAASALRGVGSTVRQGPPAPPGAKVLSFPSRPSPAPAQLPKASGM